MSTQPSSTGHLFGSDTYLLTGLDWEVGLFGEDFFPDEMLTHSTPLSTSSLARLLTYLRPRGQKSFFPFPHVQLSSAQLRPFVLLLSATLAPRAELYIRHNIKPALSLKIIKQARGRPIVIFWLLGRYLIPGKSKSLILGRYLIPT